MEPGILTSILRSFKLTFELGGERLIPEALLVLGSILALELLLIGVWWVYGQEHNLSGLLAKLMGFFLLMGLILQWKRLTNLAMVGFIELGLKAGGDLISVTDFTDPGNIAGYGFTVTGALFTKLMGYTGADAILNLPEILLASPIGLLIVLTYFALAIWIFVTLLDFYAHAAISTILLPFALNSKVAFLTEKALAVVFASLLRLLVLCFITAATLPILVAQSPGFNTSLRTLFSQLLGALAVAFLAWRADKSAQALLHGAPRLSIADTVQFVRTTARTAQTLGAAALAGRSLPGRNRTI